MLSAIAELEREQIVERTLAGLEAARKSGKKSGPKPKAASKEVKALVHAGLSVQQVCKSLSISRATVYRLLAT
jgi:DNA invertase Pin-like site-specific DNA recombinase